MENLKKGITLNSCNNDLFLELALKEMLDKNNECFIILNPTEYESEFARLFCLRKQFFQNLNLSKQLRLENKGA